MIPAREVIMEVIMMPGKEGMANTVAGALTSEKEWKFMAVIGQVAATAAMDAPKPMPMT